MNTETNNDDWRNKYLESVRSLESEEKRFRDMEAILKRLAGRLCIASLGLSPPLDQEIKKLQAVMRRDTASHDELEKILPTLTAAIHALDDNKPADVKPVPVIEVPSAPTPVVDTPSVDDKPVRAILASLLNELKRDAALRVQAETIDAKLAAPISVEELPNILASITEIIGRRIQHIELAKHEAEELLSQMVGRLDEISQFVAEQSQHQTQAMASSETFNANLTGEMKVLGENVESASDLQMMRTLVRSRLDVIDHHLQEFRERETQRNTAIIARNEQMQARVTQLEAEAQKLHTQLKAEQQVSLFDALTKVPNRLAYDKRIAEELTRWQRFDQPTCVAAWDVDHFKNVNDTYGHPAGDRVLRAIADCLMSRTRQTDFLGRYGGEEFVSILSGTTIENALLLIEEMRTAVSKIRFHFRGKQMSVTISCGVTELKTGDTAESIFERADKALYQAKKEGRNRSVRI